jgi:hypothetical protein
MNKHGPTFELILFSFGLIAFFLFVYMLTS